VPFLHQFGKREHIVNGRNTQLMYALLSDDRIRELLQLRVGATEDVQSHRMIPVGHHSLRDQLIHVADEGCGLDREGIARINFDNDAAVVPAPQPVMPDVVRDTFVPTEFHVEAAKCTGMDYKILQRMVILRPLVLRAGFDVITNRANRADRIAQKRAKALSRRVGARRIVKRAGETEYLDPLASSISTGPAVSDSDCSSAGNPTAWLRSTSTSAH
jgi:hypothetical protein